MIDKDSARVKVVNSQNIELSGYYFPNGSDICVMCVPGFGGAFGSGFIEICEGCIIKGLDFLFCHNQGSYTEKKLKKFNSDGSFEWVNRGGCYENPDNIIPDMDAWLDFIANKNYKEIYIVCASLGCDKVVKYINEKPIEKLKKIVFMCPQDIEKQCDEDMLSEAIENIKNNQPDKILTKLFLDFCPITSKTQYDLAHRDDIHNFKYLHDNPTFDNLNKINVPVLCIIGTLDQGLTCGDKSPEYYMSLVKENIKDCKIQLIEGAKHSFKNYENEMAEKVITFLKEN